MAQKLLIEIITLTPKGFSAYVSNQAGRFNPSIKIAGGKTYTRKRACLKAAERLKDLARQFEELAKRTKISER